MKRFDFSATDPRTMTGVPIFDGKRSNTHPILLAPDIAAAERLVKLLNKQLFTDDTDPAEPAAPPALSDSWAI